MTISKNLRGIIASLLVLGAVAAPVLSVPYFDRQPAPAIGRLVSGGHVVGGKYSLVSALLGIREAKAANTTFVKFNQFVQDQAEAKHNFSASQTAFTYGFELSNTLPNASTAKVYGDISANEVAAASGGYTTGGFSTTLSDSLSGGVLTSSHATLTIAPTGSASIGPFQYITLYNKTNGALVGVYNIGASTTLNAATSDTYTLSDPSGFLTAQ